MLSAPIHEFEVALHDDTLLLAPRYPHPCTYLRRADAHGQTLGMVESHDLAAAPAAAMRGLIAPGTTPAQPLERYYRTPQGRTLDVAVDGDDAVVILGTLEEGELARISADELAADPVGSMSRMIGMLAAAG